MPTQYAMTAIYNGSNRINWVVTGAPDNTGSQSGYPTNLLTSIAIDYTTTVSSANTAGSVISQRSWQTVYQVDFTNLSTQSFSGNGNVTIDNKVWTVNNFSATTSFGVSSGNGISIACNTTNTDYNNSARTAALLYIPLTNIYNNFDLFSNKIRISVYFTDNADQSSENTFISFEDSTTPMLLSHALFRGFNPSASFVTKSTINSSSSANVDTSNSSDDIMQLTLDGTPSFFEMRTGVYSSGFPNQENFRLRRRYALSNYDAAMINSSDINLVIGAITGNTSGNFTTNIKSLKVEVFDSNSASSINTLSDGYANLPLAGVTGRLFLPNDITKPIIYRDNGSSWAPFSSGMIVDTFANRPAVGANGQLFIPSDGGNNQVWDGTKWRPILGSVLGTEPPAAATLSTQVNYSTSTLTKSNGILIFEAVSAGDVNFRGAFTSISTPSSCQIQGSTTLANNIASSTTAYPAASIAMRESSTGKMGVMYFFIGTGSTFVRNGIGITSWASATNRTSFTDYYQYSNFTPCFMRIRISSGTLYYEISNHLINWETLSSVSITSIFTTAPDQYGIGVSFFGTISSTQTAHFNHLYLG